MFSEHFNSEGHNGFLHDVSVTLIDKTDYKDLIKLEHYWWHILKMIACHGLSFGNEFQFTVNLHLGIRYRSVNFIC